METDLFLLALTEKTARLICLKMVLQKMEQDTQEDATGMFGFAVALKTEREAKEMYRCVECLHFTGEYTKGKDGWYRYKCNIRGYVPQPIKYDDLYRLVCGCGQYEEEKQMKLF